MAKPIQNLKKDRTILVRVEEDVDEFLLKESSNKRVSKAQIVRDALYRFIEEKKGKE